MRSYFGEGCTALDSVFPVQQTQPVEQRHGSPVVVCEELCSEILAMIGGLSVCSGVKSWILCCGNATRLQR
jgi:hypothetical protein